MNISDRLIDFVDRILDLFKAIKGYLNNAVAFFEKLKNMILEVVEYFKDRIEDAVDRLEDLTDEQILSLEEEHFFI
ncbi:MULTISPECIES: hypothetical protein [Myroides]|uniref:Uncharacterized protein n=1 Tax=Myroides phaeus TaxID=702745 RepID=A0A1G8F074_9FLAO|nr:hypothetical protein [Myroides phaeus]MEC4116810.1 hypothetical protein [Myroides phaeus]SDH75474.1 hypothetical protein SAMN05421818_11366 [Myroides phaeus]